MQIDSQDSRRCREVRRRWRMARECALWLSTCAHVVTDCYCKRCGDTRTVTWRFSSFQNTAIQTPYACSSGCVQFTLEGAITSEQSDERITLDRFDY